VSANQAAAADAEYWAALRQRTIVPGRETVTGRVALEGRVVHVADMWPHRLGLLESAAGRGLSRRTDPR